MSISPARQVATESLIRAAQRFPDLMPPQLALETLTGSDVGLTTAIYRTTVQRWLTLEYLLDRASRRPMCKTDPIVRAVLLGGACQLLFMSGITDYAAVDESVELVRSLKRDKAAGLVNAVLRQVAQMKSQIVEERWVPARDSLPMETRTLKLASPMLPKTDNLLQHLAVATSHPLNVVARWHKQLGRDATVALCTHNLLSPPTMTVDEQGDHAVWTRPHRELGEYLAADRRRRVQDPTSAGVVRSVASMSPGRILDYCAGVGTKTRQLALLFPGATIIATDISDERRATLGQVAETFENVQVVEPPSEQGEVPELFPGAGIDLPGIDLPGVDLLLLDVPCSNSGVLARRAEAKYRLTKRALEQLVALQRHIIEQTANWLAPGGVLLYATCSIEPAENAVQTRWIEEMFNATCECEKLTLPAGSSSGDYHDGGYHAVLRWPTDRGQ